MPEQSLDQAIESLEKVKEEAELKLPNCPHCGGKSVVDLSQLMDRKKRL